MLKRNGEDGRSGHFILVEMDEGMARNVTAERVKRVAPEYANPKGSVVEACHELPSPARPFVIVDYACNIRCNDA